MLLIWAKWYNNQHYVPQNFILSIQFFLGLFSLLLLIFHACFQYLSTIVFQLILTVCPHYPIGIVWIFHSDWFLVCNLEFEWWHDYTSSSSELFCLRGKFLYYENDIRRLFWSFSYSKLRIFIGSNPEIIFKISLLCVDFFEILFVLEN